MIQNGGRVRGMYWAGEEDRLCRMCRGRRKYGSMARMRKIGIKELAGDGRNSTGGKRRTR